MKTYKDVSEVVTTHFVRQSTAAMMQGMVVSLMEAYGADVTTLSDYYSVQHDLCSF